MRLYIAILADKKKINTAKKMGMRKNNTNIAQKHPFRSPPKSPTMFKIRPMGQMSRQNTKVKAGRIRLVSLVVCLSNDCGASPRPDASSPLVQSQRFILVPQFGQKIASSGILFPQCLQYILSPTWLQLVLAQQITRAFIATIKY